MILDANLLLYARNQADPRHQSAREWLEQVLNGDTRVGLPWQSLSAFLRIGTNPRAFPDPLSPEEAWQQVEEWLDALAIDHGVELVSTDADFARFADLRWVDPLR